MKYMASLFSLFVFVQFCIFAKNFADCFSASLLTRGMIKNFILYLYYISFYEGHKFISLGYLVLLSLSKAFTKLF